jgi:hypothetical protein
MHSFSMQSFSTGKYFFELRPLRGVWLLDLHKCLVFAPEIEIFFFWGADD